MITDSKPTYKLRTPMVIGTRLVPAIKVGDGYVSVEAHGLESDGRAHFRAFVDVPGVGSWASEDSFVTVMGSDWTHAAARALECVCDELSDEESDREWLPDPITGWLKGGANMDAYIAAEDLRSAMDARL